MKSWHLICIYYASRQMVKVFLCNDFIAWDTGYILEFINHLLSILQTIYLLKNIIIYKK